MRETSVCSIASGIVLVIGIIGGNAEAQEYQVQLDWQTSSNNGATWSGGLVEVLPTQSSVLVRLQASWMRTDPSAYFAQTFYDALIQTPGRESADTVDMFNVGIMIPWTQTFNTQGLRLDHFGDILKIDDSRDSSPPGAGTRWVSADQLPPGTGGQHEENPAILFSYRLTLDGTQGPREISGLFFQWNFSSTYSTALYVPGASTRSTLVPSTVNDATVLVIPTPASTAVLAATLLLWRRRRYPGGVFEVVH